MDRDPVTVTTLCSKRDCCPIVKTFADGSVEITDTDDGRNDKISLDREQARLLWEALGLLPA